MAIHFAFMTHSTLHTEYIEGTSYPYINNVFDLFRKNGNSYKNLQKS